MKGFRRATLLLIVGTICLNACKKDNDTPESITDTDLLATIRTASNGLGEQAFILPDSDDYASIPQDPNNAINDQKVELGKLLYHETGLAINPRLPNGKNTYSCASCHSAQAGFYAGRRQGLGEGGTGFGAKGESRELDPNYPLAFIDVQPIKSPSALNVAYQKNMLWNGQFGATGFNVGTESQWTAETPKEVNHLGYEGVEIQAIAGLAVHELVMDSLFAENSEYYNLFAAAFPNMDKPEMITNETVGLAIAAYERTLLANKAPFQNYLKGDRNAITETQKQGAILFFGEAGCVSCHNGPSLAEMEFYALGMNDLDGPGIYGSDPAGSGANLGRGSFTGNPADNFKFKVPQLYNLKDSPFYGHGSTFESIRDVVAYKNAAVSENNQVSNNQLSDEFQPLNLTEFQVYQIADFVENALYDPDLLRYTPNTLPSGFCFPNNDVDSQADLGCN